MFKKSIILKQILGSVLILLIMFTIITLSISKIESAALNTVFSEQEKAMTFNVENTITRIELLKKNYEKSCITDMSIIKNSLKNASSISSIKNLWSEVQKAHPLFRHCSLYVYNLNTDNEVYSAIHKAHKSYYNGGEPDLKVDFNSKSYTIKIALGMEYIFNHVYKLMSEEFHTSTYTPNEYVWVNQIEDYKGGDDYAIRLIHPNLKDTEGTSLSTNMEDAKGNLPYKSELEGTVKASKNDEGYFQDYYFKNKVNDDIELKHSYSKLYKPFNWIIATGIPYTDMYYTVHKAYTDNAILFYLLGLIGFIIVLLFNVIHFRYYKRTYDENLVLVNAANQAKSEFFTKISHDMRTPLNGILGMTKVLQDDYKNDGKLQDNLRQIDVSASYLSALVDDTLDVQKSELNQLTLNRVPTNITKLFANLKNIAYINGSSKVLDLSWENSTTEDIWALADKLRLTQIAINLIGNAIKFTPSKGSINVTLDTNKDKAANTLTTILTVSDSGIGISEEFLPHIFEPFAQEQDPTINKYGGTGLGLSIVKTIIDLMDGEITVQSEKNKGTTFTVVTVHPLSAPMVRPTIEEDSKTNLAGKKCLYCEDHPLNATICKRILSKADILVDIAENGKIGCDMFEASVDDPYDFILMDIRMPVMDGIEATKVIRNSYGTYGQKIPIIALSANASEDDKEASLNAGMNDHIAKPIDPDTVYETILKCI